MQPRFAAGHEIPSRMYKENMSLQNGEMTLSMLNKKKINDVKKIWWNFSFSDRKEN